MSTASINPPPSYSSLPPQPPGPPPRYSQVVDLNPQRYAVANGQVIPIPPAYQQPYAVAQSLLVPQPVAFPQLAPLLQPYVQTTIQCQHPFIPVYSYNYPYPPPISNMQTILAAAPLNLQPQPVLHQAPHPYVMGPYGLQPQPPMQIPPPPPGYVILPGSNYAVPKEWVPGLR